MAHCKQFFSFSFQEDLTEADMTEILNDLAQGRKPRAGPRSGRTCCEPHGEPTSLTTDIPYPGFGVKSGI